MDLTAPISYNGLTVSGITVTATGAPSVGTVFESVDMTDLDVDQYLDKRALDDGVDANDVYIGARRINIDGAVYGSTLAHAEDQLQAVLRAFHPRIAYNADTANLGFLAFDFRQATISTGTWTAGYVPARFYARPLRPVRTVEARGPSGGASGKGSAKRFAIALICRDPRKYAQATIAQSITTTSTAVANTGDYPSFPIVTWSMTAAGASNFRIVLDSRSVEIDMSTTTTGSFTLDYAKRTLVDGSGVSYMSLVSTSSEWTEVQPGSTSAVSGANGGGAMGRTLTWRPAFA